MNQPVFAVILNYNGHDLTGKCLDSLDRSLVPVSEAVVVDNGSNPADLALLQENISRRKNVRLLQNERNLGFSAGVNIGIREAIRCGASSVLLANNDATLDPECLGTLTAALESSQAMVAGPCIYYEDTPDRIWQAGGDFSLIRAGISVPEKNGTRNDLDLAPRFAGYLCGCVILIGKQAFEKVGYFDEAFFMYCEDVDFSLRVRRAGYELIYVPAATAWHRIESASRGRTSDFVLFHLARSRLLLLRKHFSAAYVAYGLLLHLAVYTPFRILQILAGSRSWRAVIAWLKGIAAGMTA